MRSETREVTEGGARVEAERRGSAVDGVREVMGFDDGGIKCSRPSLSHTCCVPVASAARRRV